MPAALACFDVHKIYGSGELAETALSGISASFQAGETCMLLGPSGSGKTTLLSILGGLLTPTAGRVEFHGQQVDFRRPRMLARLRRSSIGFVFQHAQLLPFLSIRENLRFVARHAGLAPAALRSRIDEVMQRLGIDRYAHRKPAELSGGQRQRVAIARAVLHRPSVILADEPTASLDWENGQAAVQLLIDESRRNQAVLITVSHDTRLIPQFGRVLRIESGKVCAE